MIVIALEKYMHSIEKYQQGKSIQFYFGKMKVRKIFIGLTFNLSFEIQVGVWQTD